MRSRDGRLQLAGQVLAVEQRYLFCLFDELAVDLGVLFDRRSPHALLFPREQALLALLELINDPEIEPLWAEDETIGWIYQYYNDPLERKKMREQSAAPRNSRELAVRNQFFTPRYVVEFLTDNTLGRIWYEMTKGQTRLKEQCRYLVRRPTEIFLNPGEDAPCIPENSESNTQNPKSQEELLRDPVHIPHRPLKDPRSILMLDPACGSMHFGLYAFDLFEALYAFDHLARPAKLLPLTAEDHPVVENDYRRWTVKIRPGTYFVDDPAFKGQKRELVASLLFSPADFFDPRCFFFDFGIFNPTHVAGWIAGMLAFYSTA
jgi:hypothetical protein